VAFWRPTPAIATVHTLRAVASDAEGHEPVVVTVASGEPVGAVGGLVTDSFGWDRDAAHHLVTPGLTRYGTAGWRDELGFERRTRDQRRHSVGEVLPRVGATARLHVGDHVVELTVDAITAADPDRPNA